MAHEIGHYMGLWDCATCSLGQSVMAFGDSWNGNNGATGPTCGDQITINNDPAYSPPPQPVDSYTVDYPLHVLYYEEANCFDEYFVTDYSDGSSTWDYVGVVCY